MREIIEKIIEEELKVIEEWPDCGRTYWYCQGCGEDAAYLPDLKHRDDCLLIKAQKALLVPSAPSEWVAVRRSWFINLYLDIGYLKEGLPGDTAYMGTAIAIEKSITELMKSQPRPTSTEQSKIIGYIEVNQKTGEISTYSPDGIKDEPIQFRPEQEGKEN